MAKDFGDVPAGSVLPIFFDAIAEGVGSITISGLAVTDIEIFKGTSMTQRASDAGYALLDTDGIDLDGFTGIHGVSADLSDNTDAGFYEVGSFYTMVIGPITVDGQTVNVIAATFRIVAAETVAGVPKVDLSHLEGTSSPVQTLRRFFASGEGAHSNNLDSATTTTITDTSLNQSTTDQWKGAMVVLCSGNAAGQARLITAFDPATDTITFTPALTTAPSGGDAFIIVPHAMVDLWGLLGTVMATPSVAGVPEVDITHVNGAAQTATLDTLPTAVWDVARSGHVTQGTYGESYGTIVSGTVNDANTSPTTTVFAASDITEATADHFNGRTIIFTTGALKDQATDITDYELDTGEGKFTVTALTEAPADGDQFVII